MTEFPRLRAISKRCGPSASGMAGSAIVTTPYRRHNVTVVGGGFAPGLVFSKAERGLAYLCTNMGGGSRWDAAVGRWIPVASERMELHFLAALVDELTHRLLEAGTLSKEDLNGIEAAVAARLGHSPRSW